MWTVDGVAVVVVDGSDDGDEPGGCEPARSHGFGGEAIVATKMSWEIVSALKSNFIASFEEISSISLSPATMSQMLALCSE